MGNDKLTISPVYDIRLLPYSPVYERDRLEIRCQMYNEGEDKETELVFSFDEEVVYTEKIKVKKNTYGFARCYLNMAGRKGRHIVSVNGATCGLEVLEESEIALDGGFVMIGPPNKRQCCDSFRNGVKSFTDDNWKNYIAELAKMKMDCIIINAAHQYLNEYEKSGTVKPELVAHYDSSLYPKSDIVAVDPIAAILAEAEKHEQKVFIGIGNNYGYAGKVEDIQELYERYNGYKAFYGWYMAWELDMENFDCNEWNYLSKLVSEARKLSPVKPILTSPYRVPGEAFLAYLVENDVFDIMMPQDWVGQKRLSLQESATMHRLLLEACQKAEKHLWANCEAFNFLLDTPLDRPGNLLVPRFRDGGMDGEAGFIQQMETVRPYVEKIMNYMFTGFFTPPDFVPKVGGEAAVKQYKEYIEWINKSK